MSGNSEESPLAQFVQPSSSSASIANIDAIQHALLDKVVARGLEKSICPSEVARAVGGDRWRELMPVVRQVGTALADDGKIVVLQKGLVVDPRTVKGPIRYRTTSIDH
ncbi:MAG: DUF3253 domain-containing protein [Cyanobacteria bacterium J06626_14]